MMHPNVGPIGLRGSFYHVHCVFGGTWRLTTFRFGMAVVTILLGASMVMAAPVISATPTIWLDADDNSTVTTTGTAVTSWSNKGSLLGSFTQSAAARQPTYVPAAVGGLRDVVRFDGTVAFNQDYMDAPLHPSQVITASAYTVFTVFKGNVVNGTSTTAPYLNGTIIGDAGYGGWGTFVRGGATPQSQNYQYDGTNDVVALNITNDQYYLNTGYLSGPTLFGQTRGQFTTETGSTPSGNVHANLFLPGRTTRLGANYLASGGFLTGDIAEILVYNTTLSAPDRAAVENYLHGKWLPEPSGGLAVLVMGASGVFLRRHRSRSRTRRAAA